ncbi:MAG: metal-sensitive transcriptional regulator, partial [Leptonema sp. (in: Bacteria)]|nr:metal-sensitive transcriptional regulator [Leptonema sp. (in: bacteria)]
MAVRKIDSSDKTPQKSKESVASDESSGFSRRLNRIQGQILGISKMIEDDRTCVDILNQISAVKSALDGVAMGILEKQAFQCFQSPTDSE